MRPHSTWRLALSWFDQLSQAVHQISPVRRHFYVYTLLLVLALCGGKLEGGCDPAQFEDDVAQVDEVVLNVMCLDHQAE
jgi:hypothetical protein